MDNRTLNALRDSITKWERIVNGTGENLGVFNCALCHEFNNPGKDYDNNTECKGCPVYEKVGRQFCFDTPYQKYIYHDNSHEDLQKYAVEELEFLKSLLPTGETQHG